MHAQKHNQYRSMKAAISFSPTCLLSFAFAFALLSVASLKSDNGTDVFRTRKVGGVTSSMVRPKGAVAASVASQGMVYV
jgi:hypothetical protein